AASTAITLSPYAGAGGSAALVGAVVRPLDYPGVGGLAEGAQCP
ncbi:MAG: hypothetical protein QOI83_175, partial [Streptomycetaceae bacterium]|nr:hypothetical protein [Streptomycetaceae bacterium]